MDFESLTPERRALLYDMINTMTNSLLACSPQEASVVLSNVMARLVYMAAGDGATDAQVDGMLAALTSAARLNLVGTVGADGATSGKSS